MNRTQNECSNHSIWNIWMNGMPSLQSSLTLSVRLFVFLRSNPTVWRRNEDEWILTMINTAFSKIKWISTFNFGGRNNCSTTSNWNLHSLFPCSQTIWKNEKNTLNNVNNHSCWFKNFSFNESTKKSHLKRIYTLPWTWLIFCFRLRFLVKKKKERRKQWKTTNVIQIEWINDRREEKKNDILRTFTKSGGKGRTKQMDSR